MAVIKIVPMPGIPVQGPSGPQGEQGPPGADGLIPTSGTWNPKFAEKSGIVYNDSASLHEFAEYYCIGKLVFFDVYVKLSNVSDWGNSIAWTFELPFLSNKHGDANWDYNSNSITFTGSILDSNVAENIEDRTGRDQGLYTVYGTLEPTEPNTVHLSVTAYDSSLGYNMVGERRALNKSYPSDLTQPEIDQSSFRMSGVYRKI